MPLLFLADGRFPAGGHTHSLTTEPAVEYGIVSDQKSLSRFLLSRLRTSGVIDATFSAHAGSLGLAGAEVLDAEYEARTLSPKTRKVSRQLGRQLLDTAAGIWPDSVSEKQMLCPEEVDKTPVRCGPVGHDGWHHPVAFGLVAHVLGVSPAEAASAMIYQFATTITTTVVRLLGLDPVVALKVVADQPLTELVANAVATLGASPAELPSISNPLVDIMSEEHDRWDMKLFAS